MAKHTPGPWELEEQDGEYRVRHHWEGVIVWVHDEPIPSQRNPEKTEANARLIAAAPDLLAALKMAIRYAPTKQPAKGVAKAVHDAWNEAEQARAAIAKAEGE